jgi:hypothetical protein
MPVTDRHARERPLFFFQQIPALRILMLQYILRAHRRGLGIGSNPYI